MKLGHSFERVVLEQVYRRHPHAVLRLREAPAQATLVFAGDLALHHWKTGKPPDEVFAAIRNAFAAADFSMVNLESVLTSCNAPSGRIGRFIRAAPESVACLEYLGVTSATCANNHALDFGAAGLAESGRILKRAGIGWAGVRVGADSTSGELVREVNGVQVGVIAATDHWGGMPTDELPSPVWVDPEGIRHRVRALRSRCHVVVVQLHWGYERVMHPLRWHRDFARQLVEDGADVVCCHHAHVVMGVERWRHGVIAYGLGNFYFGSHRYRHPLQRFGLLMRLSIDREGLVTAEPFTVSTDAAGRLQPEERACPGFRRLCQRVLDDGFLERVEGSRAAMTLMQLGMELKARFEARDVTGLLERQAFLRAQRQEWLLTYGGHAASIELRALTTWLLQFRSQPAEAVRRLELPPLRGMGRLRKGRLSGRWP